MCCRSRIHGADEVHGRPRQRRRSTGGGLAESGRGPSVSTHGEARVPVCWNRPRRADVLASTRMTGGPRRQGAQTAAGVWDMTCGIPTGFRRNQGEQSRCQARIPFSTGDVRRQRRS